MIEKVPRMPQATATVSEMARIKRAAIDRSLNMGNFPKRSASGRFGKSQKEFNNLVSCYPGVIGKNEGRLCGVAQAGEEGVDAFEQCGGVLAQFAGGDQDVAGQNARLVGGVACAGDIDRDLAGAGGGLLHAARN